MWWFLAEWDEGSQLYYILALQGDTQSPSKKHHALRAIVSNQPLIGSYRRHLMGMIRSQLHTDMIMENT